TQRFGRGCRVTIAILSEMNAGGRFRAIEAQVQMHAAYRHRDHRDGDQRQQGAHEYFGGRHGTRSMAATRAGLNVRPAGADITPVVTRLTGHFGLYEASCSPRCPTLTDAMRYGRLRDFVKRHRVSLTELSLLAGIIGVVALIAFYVDIFMDESQVT